MHNNLFDAIAARRPRVAGRVIALANLYVIVVPAATLVAVIAGPMLLAVGGVLACIGCYLAGLTVASVIYAQRLHHEVAEARTDPLTGLPNRAPADAMIDEASRTGTPITAALIDVNGLHTINTNLGHAAGDQYLTLIAARLSTAVPTGGLLVRQGGDEFTLLAPNTRPQDLADRIGAALAGPATIAGYRVRPRASVGIATTATVRTVTAGRAALADAATLAGPVDPRQVRARADAALYTAKRDGGNQIRLFDPDRDPEPSPDGTRPLVRRRDTNPVADAGMAWLPSPGDDLIPVLLAPDELRAAVQAMTSAADTWAKAAAEATAAERRLVAEADTTPREMTSTEPSPTAYASTARQARDQASRYTRLLERLRPVIEAADILDEAGETLPSATAPTVSYAVLIGISAAFTPADLEALVITAAEAVHGQATELSSRQRELAARAWDLLHDDSND